MGTRSRIGIQMEDDTIRSIYCHWDGYPSHNGKLLLEHYNTDEKIHELIKLGSLSSLHESIEKPKGHSYDNPIEGYTVAYHRDRFQNWNNGKPFKVTHNEKGLPNNLEFDIEYYYVFRSIAGEKPCWYYINCYSKNPKYIKLTQKSCKLKIN